MYFEEGNKQVRVQEILLSTVFENKILVSSPSKTYVFSALTHKQTQLLALKPKYFYRFKNVLLVDETRCVNEHLKQFTQKSVKIEDTTVILGE